MRCGRCKTENPDGNRFCNACGAALEKPCPACGSANPPGSRFCGQCGAPLAGPAAATRAESTAPLTTLPKHLASRILDARRSLEGERKQVTVLFADIRGSLELIHQLDPEQAIQRLDPGIEAMIDAVHRYEGTVARVQGDGIMALFGAPLAHEDHAVRACLAARAMLDAAARLGREGIQIRVGLNSGEVVVRSIGNDLSMDYDAVGSTVHLANRMEQLAPPGAARLTAYTARLAKGFIDARPVGTIAVKGVNEPVELYELIAAAGRSRWDVRASSQSLTRFVGRASEMLTLAGALRRASQGRGQLVALVGEAGMGKSRLVHEFLAMQTEEWLVLRGATTAHERTTPYLLIAELLRAWLEIGERDGHAEIAAKLRLVAAAVDAGLAGALAPLESVLALPVEDPAWAQLEPLHRRERIAEGVKRLLLAMAVQRPLLVVTEDLHWIDPESQSVLDALVEGLAPTRILVIATYRPEYQHRWASRSYYGQLHVDPLEADEADDLLRHHLGDGEHLAALRRHLIERTEGTPFFLEEIVRTLVETGVLVREPVDYRLTRAIAEIEVPDSVQAVLAARIDRLPPELRSLLQLGSVIGKDVPLRLLQAVAGLPLDELRRRLTELQSFEFLYEVASPSGTEFTFKHALTHAVAYEGMLLKHRRTLHAQVLQAIEDNYAERLEEFTERLAEHALKGESWESAVGYHVKAGERAIRRSAHREAIQFFERALEALSRLPVDRGTIEHAIEIRLGLRVAFAALGELREIRRRLDEAARLAEQIDDRSRLASINISRSLTLAHLGSLDEAIAAGRYSRAHAADAQDPGLTMNAGFALAQAYWSRGDFQEAAKLLEADLETVGGEWRGKSSGTTGTGSVLCLVGLSHNYCALGMLERARHCSDEAMAIARDIARPYDLSYAHAAHGLERLTSGETPTAIAALEEALRLCREAEIRLLFPHTARYLGRAYALAGRFADAEALLAEAIEQTQAQGLVGLNVWCLAASAQTHLLAGERSRAAAVAEQALALARQHGYRPVEIQGLRLLGAAAAEEGDEGLAEQRFGEALTLATSLGMLPEVANIQRDLAQLHRRAAPEKARIASAAASAAYAAMGLHSIAAQLDSRQVTG